MGLVGESTHLRPIYLNLQIEVMRLSPSFLQTWNNLHSSPLGPTMSGLSSAFSNLKGRLTYSWYLTPFTTPGTCSMAYVTISLCEPPMDWYRFSLACFLNMGYTVLPYRE